jgi:SAM-dependent methyltransferase
MKRAIKKLVPPAALEVMRSFKYIGRIVPDYRIYKRLLRDKSGLEIGGPSNLFRTILPIYKDVGHLDGINFAATTIWSGGSKVSKEFNYYGNRYGSEFICEATELKGIKSSNYDFILSSNCLEHIANPLQALREWRRVLRPGGLIVLVVPRKCNNFDRRREITSFAHLIDDFKCNVDETDLTHLDEILRLHDLALDPAAGSYEEFKLRSLDNFKNRCLHHHVFDMNLANKVLEHAEFKMLNAFVTDSDICLLGQKE